MTKTPYPLDYVYDLECYPNFFSLAAKRPWTGDRWRFEISDWHHAGREIYEWLVALKYCKGRMVGFNNLHYDYPMLHLIINRRGMISTSELYSKSRAIFNDPTGYAHNVRPSEVVIPQCDLLKIHHLDNPARRTGLKTLEFNMGSQNIKDLPYDPNLPLNWGESRNLLVYGDHDVDETEKFYLYTLDMISMREDLSKRFDKDFTNFSDKKIGSQILSSALRSKGVKLYDEYGNKIQTLRNHIDLGEIVLPYVKFENQEFARVKRFFESQVITETNGVFKGLTANVGGLEFIFGSGGIHASLHNTIIRESATHKLLDIDVASFYPNLAIVNRLFPEHLTEEFCPIYFSLYKERKALPKGSPENGAFKLALNGAYGDSNNIYSPFYDPKYTMSITVNGQLLLCMLAEQLIKIPGLTLVQANTDGLTIHYPRMYDAHVKAVWKWWEDLTRLELEGNVYQAMYIRDVNNYMALKEDGSVKRIGAYAHVKQMDVPGTREITWNKNHSGLVIPKAAEAALVHGVDIEEFIRNHTEWGDFMMVTKVPRSSRLELREGEQVTRLQNISRYIVAKKGGRFCKIMPPLQSQIDRWRTGDHYEHVDHGKHVVVEAGDKPPSGKYKLVFMTTEERNNCPDREMSIESGWDVIDCCDMRDFDPSMINYDYYISKAKDLVNPLLKGGKM